MTDSSNIYNTKRDCLRDPLAGCNKQKDLSRKSVHRPSILSGHGRARERKKKMEAAGSDNARGLLRGGGAGGDGISSSEKTKTFLLLLRKEFLRFN